MPKPYTPNDTWSRKAAAEGYRARSVYKLKELDERLHLLKPGMKVLDLGAAPGSWLQYIAEKIGPRGRALGIDLTPVEPVGTNVGTRELDITDTRQLEQALTDEDMQTVDLVLSDIAPSTSGIKDVDQWRSVELAMTVVAIADGHLVPGGKFVVKVFRGSDFDTFMHDVRHRWHDVRVMTVKASRDRSREVYVIARKARE